MYINRYVCLYQYRNTCKPTLITETLDNYSDFLTFGTYGTNGTPWFLPTLCSLHRNTNLRLGRFLQRP